MTNPTGTAVAKVEATLKTFLERHRGKIAEAAANRIDPDRLLRVALVAAKKSEAIGKCTADSVLLSLIQSAALGLEAGGSLGEAYLVPFGDECTLIIGYRGLIALARRSGSIAKVEARPVFKGEKFVVHYGTNPGIDHDPNFTTGRTKAELEAVYTVWTLNNGEKQFDVMSAAEVEAIRGRSRAKDRGPWVTDYVAMGLKSVTRRSAKMVPMTVEMAEALDRDAEAEFGDAAEEVIAAGAVAQVASGTANLKSKLGLNPANEVRVPEEVKPEDPDALYSEFYHLMRKDQRRRTDEDDMRLEEITEAHQDFAERYQNGIKPMGEEYE